MAYFSNGSEGQMFRHNHCRGCIHEKAAHGGCPVFDVHLMFNREQLVEGKRDNPLAKTLTMLIDDEKSADEMCSMRHLPKNAAHLTVREVANG